MFQRYSFFNRNTNLKISEDDRIEYFIRLPYTHTHTHTPVSYTHLDVYKRQVLYTRLMVAFMDLTTFMLSTVLRERVYANLNHV